MMATILTNLLLKQYINSFHFEWHIKICISGRFDAIHTIRQTEWNEIKNYVYASVLIKMVHLYWIDCYLPI